MSLLAPGLLYFVLLLILAVISATETAIHSARDLDGRLSSAGRGGVARKLRNITANPFAQLHRALLLSATLNLVLAALGLHLVSGPFRALGWQPWLTAPLLFASTVLVGDVMPKFLAAWSPSAVLLGSLRILHPLRVVLDPLSGFADRVTEALIQRMIPQRVKMRASMTREEFETLVEMREEQGLLDPAEAQIIQEALDLEKLTVRDCMVPRVDLTLLSAESSQEQATEVLDRSAGRFVVVHGETPDAVVGIIDTLTWRMAGRPPWQDAVKHAPFVPETLPVLDSLEKHLQHGPAPVLILDEYGGLEGMLSQEEIADWLLYEAAPWQGEAGEIRDLGNGRFLADGGARIEDVAAEVGLELPAGGIDTIGGFVLTQLGHAPKPGERIHIAGADLKVRRCVRARIQQVELRLHADRLHAAAVGDEET